MLRGFALFGIILNHSAMNFLAGMSPPEYARYNMIAPVDEVLNMLSMLLTFGKFYTIFSFLFGLSFAIQLQQAMTKDTVFTGRFIWRLVILFLIGYVHNLFFSGDILVIYACLGLVLVVARKLNNKMLLIISAVLVLNIPLQLQRAYELVVPPVPLSKTQQEAQIKKMNQQALREFKTKLAGNASELVRLNAATGLQSKYEFQKATGRLWITAGLFLLGLYAGRKKIFEQTPQNRRFFRKLCLWGGVVALASTAAALLIFTTGMAAKPVFGFLGSMAFDTQQIALSAFYVAGVVLLYWGIKGRKVLQPLVPLGQMGLTIYLLQTLFGLMLFYGIGFGMLNKIGVAAAMGYGALFFIFQVLIAKWWLTYFRMGPVEWLWRSLTYLKVQPLRKQF